MRQAPVVAMLTRRKCICIVILVVALGAAAIASASILPFGVIVAALRGESFVDRRPASHWREVLREQAAKGQIEAETRSRFLGTPGAVPVLTKLMTDHDPTVRWAAAALLAESGFAYEVIPPLRTALSDSDDNVRIAAADGLGRLGPNGRAAMPAIVELLQDPHDPAWPVAQRALWRIDPQEAIDIGGWKPFVSSEHGFGIQFPGQPAVTSSEHVEPFGRAERAIFSCAAGPLQYAIAVTSYPEAVDEATSDELFAAARERVSSSLFGEMLEEHLVQLGTVNGRENVIHTSNGGIVRSRLYIVSTRLYHMFASYPAPVDNPPAAKHFFDSFQLINPPAAESGESDPILR